MLRNPNDIFYVIFHTIIRQRFNDYLPKKIRSIYYYYVAIMTKIGSYEHDEMSTLAKSTLYNGEREGKEREKVKGKEDSEERVEHIKVLMEITEI